MRYTHDNACDVPMIPISGHLTPWSVDGWVIESRFVQGGYIVVADLNERNKLDDKSVYEDRSALVHGSPVYVASEKKTYRWNADTEDWDEDALDAGNILATLDNLVLTSASRTYVDDAVQTTVTTLRNEIPRTVEELTDSASYSKKSDLEDAINEVRTESANSFYKKTETYTRDVIDGKISAVSTESINYTDAEIAKVKGNYISKSETYAYIEETLNGKLEGVVKESDLAGRFYTKSEVESKLVNLATKGSVQELSAKFSDYYNKAQVNSLLNNVTVDLSSYYNKIEIDKKFDEIEHPTVDLSGYYTKTEVDGKFNVVNNTFGSFYNKTEIDAKFDAIDFPETDLSNYFTKDETRQLVSESKVSLEGYAKEQFVRDEIGKINIPTVPTNVSSFVNDAGYAKSVEVQALLQEKADTVLFKENFIVGTSIGAFEKGDSLQNLTLKEILVNLLGASVKVSPVEKITTEQLPLYSIDEAGAIVETVYSYVTLTPEEASEAPSKNCFYQIKDGETVIESGYQENSTINMSEVYRVAFVDDVDFKSDASVQVWNTLENKWTTVWENGAPTEAAPTFVITDDLSVILDIYNDQEYYDQILAEEAALEGYNMWLVDPAVTASGSKYRFVLN